MSILLAISARTVLTIALVIMILVSLLFGFILFMILKSSKKKDNHAQQQPNILQLLARQESHLNEELAKGNLDEEKSTALNTRLRRVKSAQALIDELTKEHEAHAQAKATEVHHSPEHKPAGAPAANGGAEHSHPAPSAPHPTGNPAPSAPHPTGNPAPSAPHPTGNPVQRPVNPVQRPVNPAGNAQPNPSKKED